MKEFVYSGFLFKKNRGIRDYVRERLKRKTVVMKKVWGIGEKLFRNDFKGRIRVYKTLVSSILMYGVKTWGGGGYYEVKRLHEKYII